MVSLKPLSDLRYRHSWVLVAVSRDRLVSGSNCSSAHLSQQENSSVDRVYVE